MEDSALYYRIDADDRIREVGQNWEAFAAENGGLPHVSGEAIIGRSLWEFVSDPNTVTLYRQVVARVRKTGSPHVFTLRCDSPQCERKIEMSIEKDGDSIVFRTRPVHSRPIPREDEPGARDLRHLRICSWCDRVNIASGVWIPLDTAVLALRLFLRRQVPELTHSLCDRCYNEMMLQTYAGDE